MTDPSLLDAVTFLSPLVGAGGLTAIVVAYFGTRRPSEQKPDHAPAMGISALLADSSSMNRVAEELRRLTDAVEEVGRATNRACDLMDISRAVERLRKSDHD